MKTWGKLTDGVLEIFSKRYVHDTVNKVIYSNPTEEQIKLCGYKEYIETECTLEEKEGCYIAFDYEESEDVITQVWKHIEIEYDDCYDEISTEEVVSDENVIEEPVTEE